MRELDATRANADLRIALHAESSPSSPACSNGLGSSCTWASLPEKDTCPVVTWHRSEAPDTSHKAILLLCDGHGNRSAPLRRWFSLLSSFGGGCWSPLATFQTTRPVGGDRVNPSDSCFFHVFCFFGFGMTPIRGSLRAIRSTNSEAESSNSSRCSGR